MRVVFPCAESLRVVILCGVRSSLSFRILGEGELECFFKRRTIAMPLGNPLANLSVGRGDDGGTQLIRTQRCKN